MDLRIPGDTRVAIERLLEYINDIGTITNYLQVPREWVEHTQRNSLAKRRRILDRGCGQTIGGYDGKPTMTERATPKSISRASDDLLRRYIEVYQTYSRISGQTTAFIALHLMNCSCPLKVLAKARESADGGKRKEAS